MPRWGHRSSSTPMVRPARNTTSSRPQITTPTGALPSSRDVKIGCQWPSSPISVPCPCDMLADLAGLQRDVAQRTRDRVAVADEVEVGSRCVRAVMTWVAALVGERVCILDESVQARLVSGGQEHHVEGVCFTVVEPDTV